MLPKIIRRKHVHRICYTHYESRQFTTCNFDIIIPDNHVIKRVDIKTPPKGFEILCSIGTYKMTACIFLHAFYTHLSPILPLIEMLKPVSSIFFLAIYKPNAPTQNKKNNMYVEHVILIMNPCDLRHVIKPDTCVN